MTGFPFFFHSYLRWLCGFFPANSAFGFQAWNMHRPCDSMRKKQYEHVYEPCMETNVSSTRKESYFEMQDTLNLISNKLGLN